MCCNQSQSKNSKMLPKTYKHHTRHEWQLDFEALLKKFLLKIMKMTNNILPMHLTIPEKVP